jgi:hypothetical protein
MVTVSIYKLINFNNRNVIDNVVELINLIYCNVHNITKNDSYTNRNQQQV